MTFKFLSFIGKSACDAIGATVKRLVRRLAIQGNQITGPREFYEACKKLNSTIAFDFCTNADVQQADGILKSRYEDMKIKTITGTTKYHAFIPGEDSQTMLTKTFSFSRITKSFVIATPKLPHE